MIGFQVSQPAIQCLQLCFQTLQRSAGRVAVLIALLRLLLFLLFQLLPRLCLQRVQLAHQACMVLGIHKVDIDHKNLQERQLLSQDVLNQ